MNERKIQWNWNHLLVVNQDTIQSNRHHLNIKFIDNGWHLNFSPFPLWILEKKTLKQFDRFKIICFYHFKIEKGLNIRRAKPPEREKTLASGILRILYINNNQSDFQIELKIHLSVDIRIKCLFSASLTCVCCNIPLKEKSLSKMHAHTTIFALLLSSNLYSARGITNVTRSGK